MCRMEEIFAWEKGKLKNIGLGSLGDGRLFVLNEFEGIVKILCKEYRRPVFAHQQFQGSKTQELNICFVKFISCDNSR